ncbi:potassium-transporting ATPase subunit KdpC [Granulicella sp. dw_53]|uniref:potassium-transporting ATPase subunit KdpC n=1 Tax=Granulicella sp. dw_53 TaxID=2719792 RepID=UPI001BD6665F|nr:potassium-transporting ATPase subunit KdpC [Granulicella sp. dw_53]
MKRNILTAVLYTVATTILFGLVYPLVVTGIAQLLFKDKANGQLIYTQATSGAAPQLIGSHLIGQPFTAPAYFHSRPSAAGNGYDAANSSGSNYAPTNKKLIDRITSDVASNRHDDPDTAVPIDLVTASGSGLDPDITPAAADFQVTRIARQRHLSEDAVNRLVAAHTQPRQLGFLGEPRVNVLELNLDLDRTAPIKP